MKRHRARSPHVALVLIALAAALLFPTAAEGRGGCVVADVPAPVVLPDDRFAADGTDHPVES